MLVRLSINGLEHHVQDGLGVHDEIKLQITEGDTVYFMTVTRKWSKRRFTLSRTHPTDPTIIDPDYNLRLRRSSVEIATD